MAGRRTKPYPIVIRCLEVADAYDVTPGMRRVVLTGDQLGAFRSGGYDIAPFLTENADDHVKLVVLAPGEAPPAQNDGHLDWTPEQLNRSRDYTPRRFDPQSRRLELDFVRHRGGLAAEWAAAAKPGDRAWVAGPRGTTILPSGIDWYFLVGDETALPAIARRIEELPPGTPVTAVVSVPSAADEQTFDHQVDLDITWVHSRDALFDAVVAARWRDGQVYAWAAGEAGMLRPVRRWLRQVDPEYVDVAGYWRAGRTQDEMAGDLHDLRHSVDLAAPYAVRAAVSLDLAERVLDGVTTVEGLASAAGVQARGLRALLRVLSHEGLFVVGADGSVALGPAGSVLTEDAVHDALDRRGGASRLDDAWPGLVHALRTGESGFVAVRGQPLWAELAGSDGLGESFDRGLAGWADRWAPDVAAALGIVDGHVVDVGGGTGTLLAALLAAAPDVRGTLVELPTTADRAAATFERHGLSARVSIAAQSFFEPLPAGADTYLLAQVLHNWPDAEAVRLLSRVAAAAAGSVAGSAPAAGSVARIVVVERLADEPGDEHDAAFDLQMFALFGGGERDRAGYTALAAAAGLELAAVTAVHDELHLIELRIPR